MTSGAESLVLFRPTPSRWLSRFSRSPVTPPSQLRLVLSVLAPEGDQLDVPPDGALDSEYQRAYSYAVLPKLAAPRLLLPADSWRAAACSFRVRYAGQRPVMTRIAYGLAGRSVWARMAQALPLDRLDVLQRADLDADQVSLLLLAEHLSGVLGTRVLLGAGVAARDPHQTVSLHALTGDGIPVGFVKVAWNELTRRLLRGEAEALERFSTDRTLGFVRPPRVLYHAPWGRFEVLVTEPLPIRSDRRSSRFSRRPEVDGALDIAWSGVRDHQPVVDSVYWKRTLQRMEALRAEAGEPAAEALDCAARRLEVLGRDGAIDFGPWHGDWLPWNYSVRDGQLLAWDWEYATDAAPVGFDLLHFFFGTSFFRDQLDGVSSLRVAEERGTPLLRLLGLDRRRARLVYTLYVLEMLLRRLDIEVNGGGADDSRVFPDIYDLLASLLAGE